jgi:hypothetical protein
MLFVQKQEPAKKGRKTRSKNETFCSLYLAMNGFIIATSILIDSLKKISGKRFKKK